MDAYLFLLLFCVTLSALNEFEHCEGKVFIRKEYRDMSSEEWIAFRDAMLQLQIKNSSNRGNYTEWDRMTKIHIDNGGSYHNTELFLHWHRLYVCAFERTLANIDSSVSLPYWDLSYDWQNAESSPIFSEEMGLAVRMDDSQGDCRYKRHFSNPHCIRRGYKTGNFTKLPSDDYVRLVVTQVKEFGRFSEFLEKSIHNPVHNAIGGDMIRADAPNDPIFWLFHTFIDKIWDDWEKLNPGIGYANKTKNIEPFGIPAGIAEDNRIFCYKYEPFSRAKKY